MSITKFRVLQFGPVVPWGPAIYLLQIFERNCFKRWVTVHCASTVEKAEAAIETWN